MARTLRQIDDLAIYDGRYYKDTIRDFGNAGNNATWVSTREPSFKAGNEHLTGLSFESIGKVIALPTLAVTQEFSFEVVFKWRRDSGLDVTNARIIALTSPERYLGVTSSGDIEIFAGSLFAAFGVTQRNIPAHVIATRNSSNATTIFVNGRPVKSDGAGSNSGSSAGTVGNRAAYNRTLDGVVYHARVINAYLAADEAAMLYERSRPLLSPGSPRRSGIYTSVGG